MGLHEHRVGCVFSILQLFAVVLVTRKSRTSLKSVKGKTMIYLHLDHHWFVNKAITTVLITLEVLSKKIPSLLRPEEVVEWQSTTISAYVCEDFPSSFLKNYCSIISDEAYHKINFVKWRVCSKTTSFTYWRNQGLVTHPYTVFEVLVFIKSPIRLQVTLSVIFLLYLYVVRLNDLTSFRF